MQQRQKSPNQITIANQQSKAGKPPQPRRNAEVPMKEQTPPKDKKEKTTDQKSESCDEESSEEDEDSNESAENEVGDVGGYFSAQPTTSSKLIAERQVTKLEFMRRENEQLRQQVKDLKTSLDINK